MDKYSILKQYYGPQRVSRGAEALIDAILSGRDASGASCRRAGASRSAIRSPHCSCRASRSSSRRSSPLMKDQVAALKRGDGRSRGVHQQLTDRTGEQIPHGLTLRNAQGCTYIDSSNGRSPVRGVSISVLSADAGDGRVVSACGRGTPAFRSGDRDFRPSYLGIVDFINALPAQTHCRGLNRDGDKSRCSPTFCGSWQLQSPYRIVTGFDRPNLYFDVRRPKNKFSPSAALIDERRAGAASSTVQTRAAVERVCDSLCDRGIAATRYHAGLHR